MTLLSPISNRTPSLMTWFIVYKSTGTNKNQLFSFFIKHLFFQSHQKSIVSFKIEIEPIQTIIHEKPEYPLSRFLSDVGGSFGLFLGISIASIVSYLEKVLKFFISISKSTVKRYELNGLKNFGRKRQKQSKKKLSPKRNIIRNNHSKKLYS